MKKIVVLTGIAACALIFVGCGGDKKVEERVAQIQTNAPAAVDTNTSATTVASAATPVDGKQIFATRCAACHGEKGEGKATYPKLAGLSKDVALTRIKGYVDGTYGKAQKMIMAGQAKGIDDGQKAAVAEYISTLK
jgi:cytochrome c553